MIETNKNKSIIATSSLSLTILGRRSAGRTMMCLTEGWLGIVFALPGSWRLILDWSIVLLGSQVDAFFFSSPNFHDNAFLVLSSLALSSSTARSSSFPNPTYRYPGSFCRVREKTKKIVVISFFNACQVKSEGHKSSAKLILWALSSSRSNF